MIDQDNQPLGVVTFADALAKAAEAGLDLVEVAAKATPPVCRIMDYGKFIYQESKKQRLAKKKQVQTKLKEIKFHPNINENDYITKRNHVFAFLEKGYKVKLTMFFRGREMAHSELGLKVVERMVAEAAQLGSPEMTPRRTGNVIITYLAPGPKK